ncbi:MAG: magnetosome protein MamC [Magnetococcales bacterium]|nr:magnetosome protein MamC [Magnetococcales bacterium]
MSFNLAMVLAKSVGGVGVLGGVVGGSAALAKNFKRKRAGEITNQEMAIDTSKEAVGAGVATAFSAFSAGVVGGGLVISLGTAFITAAVGKYAWDRGVEYVEAQIKKNNQGELKDEMDEAFSEESKLISTKQEESEPA